MKKFQYLLAWCAVALATTVGAATLSPVQLLNPVGSSAGQAIISTGASTAPGWAALQAGNLAPIAANTALANTTASSAAPAAAALPSCSAAGSALLYTTSTGFGCATGYAPLASPTFTGTPAAPTAAVNTNTTQLATTAFVEGEFAAPPATGFGNTTPRPVAATTISATGTITPSQTNGIVGTNTNNNANAGSVGELISSNVPAASQVALTSATPANITSISLTAGDWHVCGNVIVNPAGTTTQAYAIGSISTTSATHATPPNGGAYVQVSSSVPAGLVTALPVGCMRQSLASTTTLYLVVTSSFSVSTAGAYGFIGARRVR